MSVTIPLIENGESGASVRDKLNRLLSGAADGALGSVTQEDLDNLVPTTPPARPPQPSLSTEWLDEVCYLYINWSANIEEHFAYYDIQIKEGEDGNWIGFQSSTNYYALTVTSAVTYFVRVRAIDKWGNMSAYSEESSIVTASDDAAPATPIGLKVAAGTESIFVEWTANTESDLAFYEIYESEYSFTPDIGDNPTYRLAGTGFTRSGVGSEVTLYYWVRAVDTSGNVSPWSTGVEATTSKVRRQVIVTLTDVTFKPTDGGANTISWTAGQISYGFEGEEPTTQSIPAGAATYTGDRVYVRYVLGEVALTATTSLVELYKADSVLIGVYKGGTDFQLVLGKTYTDGGLILAQTICANQLVADQAVITGSAQIANAIIEDAHILTLSAATLKAGTALAGSITVSGTALSDLEEYASDPAARINAASTQIEPGKIVISGTTTLADWRNGDDTTKIDGGNIAANTITANLLTIGLRNVSVDSIVFEGNSGATNTVSWTAGTIKYVNNAGTTVSASISAGSGAWSSGILYIYWAQGATTLSTTSTYATALGANNLLLAAYEGGAKVRTDLGRTIIDGSTIKTGSITADQMGVGSVRATTIAVDNLAAISAQLGAILGGSLNINNRFIVASDGTVTIRNSTSGARLVITNTLATVYDANNVLRVRMGIW